MELNDLRSAVTVILFIVFIGIVIWAWQRDRLEAFEEAASLPLLDDGTPRSATGAMQ